MKHKTWIRFVDVVTVFWLAAFVTGLISTDELIKSRCGLITLCFLPVFVIDLLVLLRKEENFKTFIKRRWLDVLLVIPCFRIFRVFRILRVFRIFRVARAAKLLKVIKAKKALKLLKVRKALKANKIKKALDLTRFTKKSKRAAGAVCKTSRRDC